MCVVGVRAWLAKMHARCTAWNGNAPTGKGTFNDHRWWMELTVRGVTRPERRRRGSLVEFYVDQKTSEAWTR